MKVTVEELVQVPLPLKVTIEMGREEAFELKEILGTFGLRVTSQENGAHAAWEGRPAIKLSAAEIAADNLYGGHPWKYKRVIDLLASKLTGALQSVR